MADNVLKPGQASMWQRMRARGLADIPLAVGVVAVLGVMIIPLPPLALDIFLSTNLTVALMILLTAIYTVRPLDFSVFPSLLLITTLFRLALNVASTRLILLKGSTGPGAAGTVIKSFGQFVVGGNYFVGLVVFVILTVVNFIVITKGAERIAEVGARFTLDAMPGKQMAIDADLNAGLIDDEEAKTRRLMIGREADFYGAMDGASKFVRGDAIAGIVITLTNIIGGLLIGTLQHGMKLSDAAATFTILTIGDGLVSIIPALIISTSAGIIVSRAAGDMNMGQEFARQFSLQPRAIGLTAVVVFCLGLVPGLPKIPFFILSGGTGLLAFFLFRAQRETEQAAALKRAAEATRAQPVTPEAVEALLPLDAIELEVGYGLIPLVDEEQNGDLLERIRSIRQQFALDMGLLVPPLHVRDNLQLKPGGYVIRVKGVEVAAAELMVDYLLAMDPGDAKKQIEGVPTHEPAFNLPALWIRSAKREEAQFAGYSVVDLATVIATHLTEIIRSHADELLGRQETQRLLENLARTHPKVVEEVQQLLSLGGIQKALQNLLRERISIRDMLTICETLADYAPLTKDPDLLTEYVRQRLARAILQSLPLEGDTLPVLTVDQNAENMIQGGIQQTDHGSYLTLEPHKVQAIVDAVYREAEKMMEANMTPTIVTSPVIRRHLRRLIERHLPTVTVLSHNELVSGIRIKSVGLVSVARG